MLLIMELVVVRNGARCGLMKHSGTCCLLLILFSWWLSADPPTSTTGTPAHTCTHRYTYKHDRYTCTHLYTQVHLQARQVHLHTPVHTGTPTSMTGTPANTCTHRYTYKHDRYTYMHHGHNFDNHKMLDNTLMIFVDWALISFLFKNILTWVWKVTIEICLAKYTVSKKK